MTTTKPNRAHYRLLPAPVLRFPLPPPRPARPAPPPAAITEPAPEPLLHDFLCISLFPALTPELPVAAANPLR